MSFPRYPKYKDSGVEWLGEVPSHWDVKRVKHNLHLLTEKTTRREHPVGLENIESWTGSFVSTETQFEGDGVAFEAGDILFGKLRPYLAKVYLADSAGEAVGDFHVLRPVVGVYPRYAQYQLLNSDFISIVDGSTFGSKMPRVSWEFLGGMMFATPSLAEQTAIADVLDCETAKIDALVAEQQRLIELLKEKRQAVISHAVTKGLNPAAPMKDSGIPWLGEIPEHWNIRTVARASTKLTNGYVGPTRDILVQDGVPYIQATHVKRGRVSFDQGYFVTAEWSRSHAKSILAEGDVLIVQTGAGTGDVAVVTKSEVGFNCHALIIVTCIADLLSGRFVGALLQSEYGRQTLESIQTGGMHPHLNCGNVKYVEIPLPPKNEQEAIVNCIDTLSDRFDLLIAEAERSIALLQERRTALISAAVTGKIDVRGLAAQEAA